MMFDAFFRDTPTIYDLASFVIIILLLIVVISMHLRQMTHARVIRGLTEALNLLAERDTNGKED
jgi:hypothetical protein